MLQKLILMLPLEPRAWGGGPALQLGSTALATYGGRLECKTPATDWRPGCTGQLSGKSKLTELGVKESLVWTGLPDVGPTLHGPFPLPIQVMECVYFLPLLLVVVKCPCCRG